VFHATQCVVLTTFGTLSIEAKDFAINNLRLAAGLLLEIRAGDSEKWRGEIDMQMVITFMAVVGGMVFSLAVALLAEELIFGQVIRVFFVRQTVTGKTESKR
jgi:hypothetical protein